MVGTLRFGDFDLDEARRELRRAGRRVDVKPQVLDLLCHLARNRDRAVSRDELFSAIWPGTVVSDGALSTAVYEARLAVGDDGRRQRTIRTLRGRGFAFVSPVVEIVVDEAASRGPSATRVPFVGREALLARLATVLAEARAGSGRLVLLEGEAGIGKTATVQMVAARAAGATVYFGRCHEAAGAPPFWPWMRILREHVTRVGAPRVRAQVGPPASRLASFVPALVTADQADYGLPSGEDAAEARFQLFDAVTRLVREASAEEPLVLVLDDLHWADPASLSLLEFLAADLSTAPLLVMGTYRGDETPEGGPLASTLCGLARHGAVDRIHLAGLTRPEVHALLGAVLADEPSPDVVDVVMERTEGNPLFVREIAQALERGRPPADLRVPRVVRELIGRRLARLSDPARTMLGVASVLGRDVRLDALEAVWDGAGAFPIDALDEAVAANLVQPPAAGSGETRFTHALIRETLYEALPSARRATLHARTARAFEALEARGVPVDASTLAHHYFEAIPAGCGGPAVAHAERAAEHATAVLAYEEAVRLYRQALHALGRDGDSDPATAVRLCVALGDAEMRTGDLATARTTFLQAARLARRLDAPEPAARAAIGFTQATVAMTSLAGVHLPPSPRDRASIQDLLSAVLARHDDLPADLRAKLLGTLARELAGTAQQPRAVALGSDALELARSLGDPALLAEVIACRRDVLWDALNVEARHAMADEVVRLADRTGDRNLALTGRMWRLVDLLELADMARVRDELEVCRLTADELRRPVHLHQIAVLRAAIALLEGRFDDCERLAGEARAIGRRFRPELVELIHVLQLGALRREQGRLEEILPAARSWVARLAGVPVLQATLAHFEVQAGNLEAGGVEFERLAQHGFADLPRDRTFNSTLCMLAEVCANLRDVKRSAVLYRLLVPFATRNMIAGELFVGGSTSYQLGMLAAVLARWEESERHFDDALAFNRRIGAPTFSAQILRAYAEMLVERGWSGDASRARALIDDGLAVARANGMRRLEWQLSSARERARAPRSGATAAAGRGAGR